MDQPAALAGASNLTVTNTIFYSQYVEHRQANSGQLGLNPSATNAVMPKLGSPVEYDTNGAFRKGTLTIGSTGNAVQYQNTTVGTWLPSWYQIDCGASYNPSLRPPCPWLGCPARFEEQW